MTVTLEMIARTQEPQRVKHENNLRLFSIGGLICSASLTITGCIFQGQSWHWGRTGMLLLAVPPLVAAKVASDELSGEARSREDRADVFTQAGQDNLYKLLTQTAPPPDAPVIEEPPALGSIEHPRTDWQPLFTELFSARNSDGTFLYPAIFLTGRQGTGKTTFLKYIQQLLTGEIVVIDSHYKMGNWQGCKVIGKAQDYQGIEEYLKSVDEEIKSRYQIYSSVKNAHFDPVTVIAEEMTNWAGNISKTVSQGFMKGSLSDFRKVNYRLISVAHADTNTARGGAEGTAKMRANGEVRIELIQKGLALVTMPGEDDFYLAFPNLEHYTGAPGPQPPTPPTDRAPLPTDSNVLEFTGEHRSNASSNEGPTADRGSGRFTAQDVVGVITNHLERKNITEPITIGRVRSQVRQLKELPDYGWTMFTDGLRYGRLDTGRLNVTVNGETIKVSLAANNAA